MLIKPRGITFNDDGRLPNAAQGINGPMADTVCGVKSIENLCSRDGHEKMKTEFGKWQEERRETPLCSVFDFENPQAMKWQQEQD